VQEIRYNHLDWLERIFRPNRSIGIMKVWQAKASETIKKGQDCIVIQDQTTGNYFVAAIKKPRKVRKNVSQDKNNS
jgi:hypothetical protein